MPQRIVDVAVAQTGGDNTCAHPHAVLYLKMQTADHIDRAFEDLQSAPALDVPLSISDDYSESSKV
jgi:hypothetical protein